jgi:general secretion pathway protein G
MRKAFTMIELVFVIVVIGILVGVAVPKLAATRDDASISKAKTTVAAVRSALGAEKQKRILRGNFDKIKTLGDASNVFDTFDGGDDRVLEYPVKKCDTGKTSCWEISGSGEATQYIYKLPSSGEVTFQVENNRFVCKSGDCSKLE